MIQNVEYAWEDIIVVAFGRPLTGIQGIEYTTSKVRNPIYGRGDKPHSISRGQKSFTGTMTLLQSELEAIHKQLPPGKDITDIVEFTIVVSYAPEGGVITTDKLMSCCVTELKKGMKTGDDSMVIELPLVIGDIKNII